MVTLEEMENFHQKLVQKYESAQMDVTVNEIILEIRQQRVSRSHHSVSLPTRSKPTSVTRWEPSEPLHYHRPHPQRADDFVDPHPATYFVDQTNGHAYVKPPTVTHPAYVNPYLPIKTAQLTTTNLSEHTAKTTASTASTVSTISINSETSETSGTPTFAESTTTVFSAESATTVTSEEGPTIMAVKAPLSCDGMVLRLPAKSMSTDLQTTVIPHACRTCSQTFQYSNQLHDHLRATSHFRGLPPKPLHSEKPTDTPHSTPYPTKPRTFVTTAGNTATPYAIRQPRFTATLHSTLYPTKQRTSTAIPHSCACRTCNETFLSSNSLHEHLRTSGHTTPSCTNSHFHRRSKRTNHPSQSIPSRVDKPWRKQVDEGSTMGKAT
ncbi:MAG: hypothetical protein M1830_007287 [Pleopsidium flavum]|nr:MAG: hypothetical protein M1830_007287 [Pleopsidium flavum]